ncbi:MAG: YceI family protein [Gemmatimonadetes bacterium]|nr:YceI family protein [Gemmatimonadota bacterium]
MRLNIMHALASTLILVPAGITTERLVSQPQSKIWIEGTSTVKAFQCTAPEFNLTVSAEGSGAVPAVLAAQKPVKKVELVVPAAKLDCGNGTMNDHMKKALKSDEHQAIRFTLDSYDVAKGGDGVAGTVRGSLDLGGRKRAIDVKAVASDAGNGALRVVGGYELALSDYDLKRPSLMFGRIKVGDKVQVKFDLVLKTS